MHHTCRAPTPLRCCLGTRRASPVAGSFTLQVRDFIVTCLKARRRPDQPDIH